MRALDPRLVRRTRSVRPLLIVDTALGVATTAFVLLQATLLAQIVAGAFAGAPASELRRDAVALALAFAGRGALAWGMEVAGRRAAASVLSELRLALVARRLETQPTAADGTQSGEIAAAAVQGVEALEAYFARYLPQVVLASIVPFVVVGVGGDRRPRVGARDGGHAAARAGLHVADRPRHRAAHPRALARPAAAVDGLPRRRARPADAALVQSRRRAGGPHRRGQRAPPPRDDGDAAPHASCRGRCSSWPPPSASRSSR